MTRNGRAVFVILFIVTIATGWFGFSVWNVAHDESLTVRFLDVGQGDAILISQGMYQILVDGGRDERRIVEYLGEYMPFWDRTVEVVVGTHPDQDHIGGLLGVFRAYKVDRVLHTLTENDSQLFGKWQEAIGNEDTIETFAPLDIKFPNGTHITSLYPDHKLEAGEITETNDASIVLKVEYGENSFLLTGDLPSKFESQLHAGEIDVLKAGHHGSKYSTSEEFLDEVRPTQAILSVGANNRYGHPAPEVVERLKRRGIQIFRTDEQGTITYICHDMREACEVSVER